LMCNEKHQGAVPILENKQQLPKASQNNKWFAGMATKDEMHVLRPPRGTPQPDAGDQRRIVAVLNGMIVERLKSAFKQKGVAVPPSLEDAKYSLPVSGISTYTIALASTKSGAASITLHPPTFASWRENYERDFREKAAESGGGPLAK